MTTWDADIAALDLSDEEKNGLQVYRNYQRAFESHAAKILSEQIDAERYDLAPLKKVSIHLVREDPRILPVIVCAFADDRLSDMFKSEIPDGIPQGRGALFGPYGPLSNLFNRIQLAYAFDMLSPELLSDLNKVRMARNDLSHTWDLGRLENFFARLPIKEIFPIESLFNERSDWFPALPEPLEPLKAFRVRLIWMLARLTYETAYYARARKQRLDPVQVLYGPNHPKLLSAVSEIAIAASKQVTQS